MDDNFDLMFPPKPITHVGGLKNIKDFTREAENEKEFTNTNILNNISFHGIHGNKKESAPS